MTETPPMTVTEHNEHLVLQKAMLQQQLDEMRKGIFTLAHFAADDKDKVRVPKQQRPSDVLDVSWKTLKGGSVVFTIHRQQPPDDG